MTLSWLRPKALVLFLFVFAGYYKAADVLQAMPVDITLLFAGLTSLLLAWTFFQDPKVPPGAALMLCMFAVLLLGLRWPIEFGSYAGQKSLRLFSLTALAAFAPLLLLRDDRDRLFFAAAVAALGVVMAAVIVVGVGSTDDGIRTSAFNVNPILAGRASGFAALFFLVLYWFGRLTLWQMIVLVALALIGLLLSGSRGPLLALACAAVLSASALKLRSVEGRRAWLTIGLLAVVGTIVLAWLAAEGHRLGQRMMRIAMGELGDTELTRLALWEGAWQQIPEHPFGVGWGRFTEVVQVYHDALYANAKLALYPHNTVLEIALEAGWLAGAIFACLVAWLWVSLYKRLYRRLNLYEGIVSAGFVYWFSCSLVSGDVNDNRPFWAFLAVSVYIVMGSRSQSSAAQSERHAEPNERFP